MNRRVGQSLLPTRSNGASIHRTPHRAQRISEHKDFVAADNDETVARVFQCVMLSRHRAACLVIGRTGIGAALDRYRMGEPPPLTTAVDPEYTGWRAHRRLLRALDRGGRVHRLVPVTTQADHEQPL